MRADSAAPCHVDKPGGAISGISMSLSVSGLVTRPMLINMFIHRTFGIGISFEVLCKGLCGKSSGV